jgi:hypothetical protein
MSGGSDESGLVRQVLRRVLRQVQIVQMTVTGPTGPTPCR